VRIVAATNVNMQKAISEGRFREDLYYRLNTIPIKMPPLRERGNDVLLLFRLFAMQMAEKYKLPKITLTEDAKQLMLLYKWPGNVRQLKNITEQMSVLSQEREIDAEALKQFIPQDPVSTQLATINNKGANSYENEREILFKVLYEMRGNVDNLRREVSSLRKQMEEVREINGATGFAKTIAAVDAGQLPAVTSNRNTPNVEEAIAEEVTDAETLNLSDINRQMIEKALERNNGNRKKAAAELGISDRTLYRKIKQYGLEK